MSKDFLQPIETYYKGYKFRSRLEARWAVFFDALCLKWQYEVDGFQLTNGEYYLPDFKIITINKQIWWVEIKPLDDDGDGKLQQLRLDHHAKHPNDFDTEFEVLSGDPYDVLEPSISHLKGWVGGPFELRQRFVMCPRCAAFKVSRTTSGFSRELAFQCFPCDHNTPGGSDNKIEEGLIAPSTPHKGELIVDLDDVSVYISKIEEAYKKSRSYRF
jgi:hypothetical protein